MPFALGVGAVQAQVFDELQTVIADLNRFKGLLCCGVHPGLLIEFGDLLQYTVADKGIYQGIATEKVTLPLLDMEFGIVADDHIIQNGFQITQLNFHGGAVVLGNEFADFLLTGDIDVVDDDFFDTGVQVGNGLMDDPVHQHHIQ